jgi:hypothetical protein
MDGQTSEPTSDATGIIFPKSGLTYSQIAQIAYEANRVLCEISGETRPTWEQSEKWERDTIHAGVVAIDEGKVRSAGDSHISWAARKIDEGWRYGPERDPVKKTHPCLVPFIELPYHQRLKDHLFLAVVQSLLRN